MNDNCGFGNSPNMFILGKKNTPLNRREGTLAFGGNTICGDGVDVWNYPENEYQIQKIATDGFAYSATVSLGRQRR